MYRYCFQVGTSEPSFNTKTKHKLKSNLLLDSRDFSPATNSCNWRQIVSIYFAHILCFSSTKIKGNDCLDLLIIYPPAHYKQGPQITRSIRGQAKKKKKGSPSLMLTDVNASPLLQPFSNSLPQLQTFCFMFIQIVICLLFSKSPYFLWFQKKEESNNWDLFGLKSLLNQNL